MKHELELISTGAELLNGRIMNRHAQVLGRQLVPLGLSLTCDTTVPDNEERIAEAITHALQRADIVMVSGGLGPTVDDVTRDAVSRVVGRPVVVDEPSKELMEARYAKRGRPLRETSYRQVQVVEGATVLANRVGVAPGQRIEHNGKVLFVLPGPPQEFNAILEDHVIPWLAEHFEGHQLPKTRVSCVSGLGESDIIARFEEHHFPPHRVAVSYCAGPGRVEVRLHAEEEKDLADADEQLHAILGSTVYADERIDLPEVVGSALVHRGITVAVAESCTGGYLGHLLTNVPGSSSYFLGGVLVYSDEAKTRELDIDPGVLKTEGAVSEPVATSLAQQVRKRFSADIGVGITGIAGPDGGTEEKPVGLVYIGVASKNDCLVTRNQFPGNRVTIKEWSAMTALNQLRLFLDAQ